jgi:hypothetical protein
MCTLSSRRIIVLDLQYSALREPLRHSINIASLQITPLVSQLHKSMQHSITSNDTLGAPTWRPFKLLDCLFAWSTCVHLYVDTIGVSIFIKVCPIVGTVHVEHKRQTMRMMKIAQICDALLYTRDFIDCLQYYVDNLSRHVACSTVHAAVTSHSVLMCMQNPHT